MRKYILATIIAVFLTGCGEESKKIQAAQQLGEKHAKEIIEQNLQDNQLAIKLLNVRAREHTIRTQINDKAADAYIESFTTFIKLNNDTLASVIFKTDSITAQ